jgi:putative membrane protein
MRAAAVMNERERQTVERAIAEAEQRTGAEFVVVVASRSGHYERAEDLFGLTLAIVAMAALALAFQPAPEAGSWRTSLVVPLSLPWTLLFFAACCIGGSLLASRFPALSRPFRTRREMLDHVKRRGLDCFTTFRISATSTRCGILIYASLAERTAWVIADQALAAKLDDASWQPVCAAVAAGFRRGQPGAGIAEAVSKAAALAAAVLPPTPEHRGELANTVRILD